MHPARMWISRYVVGAGKLAGFLLIPMLSAATPLLSIPAVSYKFGADGWASIAIGQSIGTGLGVLVELGWSLTGPQAVARLSEGSARQLYVDALASKVLIGLFIAPAAFLIPYAVVNEHAVAAGLSGVAAAIVGLTPAWYFMGTARPRHILYSESLPRLGAVTISSGAILAGAPLWISPAALGLAALCAPIAGWMIVQRKAAIATSIEFPMFKSVVATVREQSPVAVGRAGNAIYIAFAVGLVGIAAPGIVAAFAGPERLQRMYLLVLQAIPNSMQAWLGRSERDPEALRQSVLKVVGANAIAGAAAGVVFAAIGPLLASVVFVGEIAVSREMVIVCAATILLTCLTRATGGLALVRYGRERAVALSGVLGAAVGLAAIVYGARHYGAIGALIGGTIAEGSVLIMQGVLLAHLMYGRRYSYEGRHRVKSRDVATPARC